MAANEQFRQKFGEVFKTLIAEGLTPNEAAAKAMSDAHKFVSAPVTGTHTEELKVEPVRTVSPLPDLQELKSHLRQLREEELEGNHEASGGSKLLTSIIRTVGRIYSDPDIVCKLFTSEKPDGGLDVALEEVHEVYEALYACTHPGPVNSLHNALENLTQGMRTQAGGYVHASNLTPFIVVLECPELLEPEFDQLLRNVCFAMDKLTAVPKQFLIAYFKTTSLTRFMNYVTAFRQHITLRFLNDAVDEVRVATRAFQLLYLSVDSFPSVHYSEFINDVLNDEYLSEPVTRRRETQIWVEDKRRGSQERPQSFLSFPFALNTANKAYILEILATMEQQLTANNVQMRSILSGVRTLPYLVFSVRRDHIVEDTINCLAGYEDADFKKPLKVVFQGEEGVDAGGVRKEFFQVMTRQLLDPSYGMFTYYEESRCLYFNNGSPSSEEEFVLVGALMGIAIYNFIILDVSFPMVIYRKLKNLPVSLDDLEEMQPSLGKGLKQLLHFDGDVYETFQLTFQISQEVFGEIQTSELKEGGALIPVTNENREEYVRLYVTWVLDTSVETQFRAFSRGFSKACGGEHMSEALSLFHAEELELLLCGNPTLDFHKLQEGTRYEDYTPDHDVIQHFWSAVHEMTDEEKKMFLKFVSGSDRSPIEGLAGMGFVISRNGGDSERLPTAHTCFNHLLLPEYSSYEKLKAKLKLAITQSEGFGLR